VELKLKRMSPSEREVALNTNDADGYVLVRPIFKGLSDYEKNEPSMRNYFPEMVRNMDLKAEVARAASLTFARKLPPLRNPRNSAPKISIADAA